MGTVEQCPCELQEKQLPAACEKRRFDAKNYGTHQIINCCLYVTKRLVYAVCFKSKSYRVNKRPLNNTLKSVGKVL